MSDFANSVCTIENCAYYIPEASIGIFSLEVYF